MASHNTADWMANLPQSLRELPLSQLVIPGTHDTGAYSLDVNGPIASDAPGIVRSISWIPGIKGVLCDWGLTQTLTFKQQLEAGIRYFDLRVALNPQDKKLYLVHTLYGPLIEDLLTMVDTFLNNHAGEVVFLDFNHFYDMADDDHKTLLTRLHSVFDTRLCAVGYPVASMTLQQMISQGKQVIVFYQSAYAGPEKQKVATRASILSPWPNTPDPVKCLEYLKKTFAKPPVSDFIVCQGVLTPSVNTILANLCSSLNKLNKTLSPLIVPWLSQTADSLNIVIGDFVEEADFIDTVLQRNKDVKSVQKFLG
ncbi:hypothetical protein RRG08_031062 [Elysia crispata]|uniref:Phosphatidylinositol-specific phospholipase C X domain-containing protein n=1 Tax=Elysia crispata TaxID=231223 RepID=A0AAE1DF03_9GAST|nr:hypothetical protein RRG08_031062 [Elysia crispata]